MTGSAIKTMVAVLGLVALVLSACAKKDNTATDSTTATNSEVKMTATPEYTFNAWPDPDKELVTDYGKTPIARFFRIHMDIPISDASNFSGLQLALDGKKEADVYRIMQEVIQGLPSTSAPRQKRGQALVDAALKPSNTLSAWPDPDKELVTDYGRVPIAKFFRIHMDIPISGSSDFKDLQVTLDSEKADDVYKIINRVIEGLPTSDPARTQRGHAVVDAALGPLTK